MDNAVKILVVDDETDFRQVMTVWLQSKGYSVITAENGNEGIRMIKEAKPDLVFMDLRMPMKDGVDTINEVRRFDRATPIIIISSFIEDPKIKEVKPAHISGIFYKNDDFEKGTHLLESALRMHKKLKK